MAKKDMNELGIDFNEMMESDFLIDTDTGNIITEKNVPGNESEEEEVEATPTKEEENKEDMIEIDDSGTPTPQESESGASSSSETNQGVLKSLAKALYEEGVISELDEEKLSSVETESEAEVLIDLIKEEINRNVNSYKENLPDKVKKIIDNYEEGVPLDVIIGLESTNQRLDTITEDQVNENEDLQKIIIVDSLKRMGLSDSKIAKRIQQFEDLGQLKDEALEALNETKEYYKQALDAERERVAKQREEYEKQQKKTLEDLRRDVLNTQELIPGMKITEKERERIYDSMTKVVDQDPNGNPMNEVMKMRSKNPIGFEKLLHYYYQLGLFNIDDDGNVNPDVSKLKASAKSNAVEELSKALKTKQNTSVGTPGRERMDRQRVKDNLESMKGLFKR